AGLGVLRSQSSSRYAGARGPAISSQSLQEGQVMHRSPSPCSSGLPVRLACALLCLGLAAAPALAAVGATEIGHFDIPLFAGGLNVGDLYSQAPHAPVLAGTSLFVPLGSYGDGLISLDLADPTAPRFLSQFTGIKSRQVAPSGNLLYSVDGERINVLDVTDPSSPVARALWSSTVREPREAWPRGARSRSSPDRADSTAAARRPCSRSMC